MSYKIYAYTNDTYSKDKKKLYDEVWLKVGDTTRDVDFRVDEQDNESNPEPLDKVFESDNVEFRDHELHDFLDDQGIRRVRDFKDGKSREWFAFDSLDHFKELFNLKVHGVERKNDYEMRPPQREACEKMLNAFTRNGYTEFLLAAKMRFGKNFTLLNMIVQYHNQKEGGEKTRVFFTSYKPNVFESIKEDIENHVLFTDVAVIDLRSTRSRKIPETDKPIEIIIASPQFIMANKQYKVLEGQEFTFLIVDEAHYGTFTQNFKDHILESTNFDYEYAVWMTGTPFKFNSIRSFDPDQSYYFTYIDEQKYKIDGADWAEDMPTFNIHLIQIADDVKKQQSYYTEEERHRMDKLFRVDDNGNFVDEAAVRLFLKQVRGRHGHKSMSPYRIAPKSSHSLWMIPRSVDSVEALASVMRSMPEWRDTKIFVAAGTGTDNEGNRVIGSGDVDDVRNHMRHKPDQNTVTLSCGRFREGTTVPEWHMILMLDDGKSAESYFQTIFRAGSPYEGKDQAHVFDFNAERSLQVVYELTEDIADQEDREHSGVIREMIDFCPILDHHGNAFGNDVTVEDIFENFDRTGSYCERFGSHGMVELENITSDISEIFARYDDDIRVSRIEVNENDTDGGKKDDVDRDESGSSGNGDEEKEEERRLNELKRVRRAIQNALRNIPTYLTVTDKYEESVNDIVKNGDSELFREAVGMSIVEFEQVLDSGVINIRKLNRRIKSYHLHEKRMETEVANEILPF